MQLKYEEMKSDIDSLKKWKFNPDGPHKLQIKKKCTFCTILHPYERRKWEWKNYSHAHKKMLILIAVDQEGILY